MKPLDPHFHLVDLLSQAAAVQTLLAGRSLTCKIDWFGEHGRLAELKTKFAGSPQVYSFESFIGIECLFFFDGDDLVFVGPTTSTVPWR